MPVTWILLLQTFHLTFTQEKHTLFLSLIKAPAVFELLSPHKVSGDDRELYITE